MENDDLLDTVSSFDDQPIRPLPNAQTAFILGILSIVPGCMCSCLGIILGIVGIVLGSNALKEYDANPSVYSEADYKNAKNGRTLSIVGIALTIIITILSFIFQIGMGALDSAGGF